ncbi:MAG: SpoIID/LytB domain-containing protein [Armatimonadetes bacterium]|nr:SpoIID/LytB domain-containing protein [Armatimonadota bacterium]
MNLSSVSSLRFCLRLAPVLGALALALGVPPALGLAATPEPEGTVVRVLLSVRASQVTVRSRAAWHCCARGEQPTVDSLSPGAELTLRARGDAVEWRPAPDASPRQAPGAFLLAQGEDWLSLAAGRAERAVPGAVEVTARDGTLRVVNEVPLDDYVAAVMAAETSPSFHREALKAMAVAIRTYALKAYDKHGPWADVCDTTHCQIYPSAHRPTAALEAAVNATRGLVAWFDGAPIDAVYSTDCGGYTEASEYAWRRSSAVPYLRAVPDRPAPDAQPYCAIDRDHGWRLTLSAHRLRRLGGLEERAKPVLEMLVTTESGRAQQLRIRAADKATGKLFTGEEWRRALGEDTLRSLRFTVAMDEHGRATLTGTGWGHGVGLCQWGAEGYARSSAAPTFRDILAHYYRGVTVAESPIVASRNLARAGNPQALLLPAP